MYWHRRYEVWGNQMPKIDNENNQAFKCVCVIFVFENTVIEYLWLTVLYDASTFIDIKTLCISVLKLDNWDPKSTASTLSVLSFPCFGNKATVRLCHLYIIDIQTPQRLEMRTTSGSWAHLRSYWRRGKMVTILQTMFSNFFTCIKNLLIFIIHWNVYVPSHHLSLGELITEAILTWSSGYEYESHLYENIRYDYASVS